MLLLLVGGDSLRTSELGFAMASNNKDLPLAHTTRPVSWLEAVLCIMAELILQPRLMEHYCLWYICERVLMDITLVIKRHLKIH